MKFIMDIPDKWIKGALNIDFWNLSIFRDSTEVDFPSKVSANATVLYTDADKMTIVGSMIIEKGE